MCPRPVRKKLTFDEESVNKLLQEIYDDTHNMRAKINRLFIKWEQKVKEGGEIAALGEQIIKLISAEAKNQDQKIMLLKYLKEVVFKDKNVGGNNDVPEQSGILSTEKKNELMDMVSKAVGERELNKRK
jgi:hypothetical protein